MSSTFESLSSYQKIYRITKVHRVVKWIKIFFIIFFIAMFLPWTQNIRVKGKVTSLSQSERPTQLNNVIPGKIVKWHVQEGELISAGDTILEIGEVKPEYFDKELLARTMDQINAKEKSKSSYNEKVRTAEQQITALRNSRDLKIRQLENKIRQQKLYISIDSANVVAAETEMVIYDRQYKAAKTMLDQGAISLTDFEKRTAAFQNGQAKLQSLKNKLDQSRQELKNVRLEVDATDQDYRDKILKIEGDKLTSVSESATAEYEIAKLRNVYTNYDERRKLYYILSPVNGQIGRTSKAGIGVVLKEGEFIADIIPTVMEKAIEIFIDPMDLPLVREGHTVHFIFDGYPAILFGGWPQFNYGTFQGKIYMIEKASQINGKFRALVTEDSSKRSWPPHLALGTGANCIALLNDVPVYYEIWRNINGFPPEFYVVNNPDDGNKK